MQKKFKLTAVVIFAFTLSACSSFQLFDDINPVSTKSTKSTKHCADDDGNFSSCEEMPTETNPNSPPFRASSTDLSFNMLGEYTEQMAADMLNDVQGVQVDQPIVVASFVHLNSSLQTTDTLGNQLAEYFINDLQKIGLPVSDHKLMGVLDVNDNGDFAFSRDMGQFYNDINIGYVLTGTMLKNNQGIIVNARIIHYRTNAVIASTSKLLPNIVVANLL